MFLSRLLPLLALASLTACFEGEPYCIAEEGPCSCDGAGVCTWECPDGGCDYEANGAGAATFTCEGGSCDLLATGQGAVIFDCGGGDCYAQATGQGDLSLSCPGGGCVVDCDGMGSCNITECDDCECNGSLTGICS